MREVRVPVPAAEPSPSATGTSPSATGTSPSATGTSPSATGTSSSSNEPSSPAAKPSPPARERRPPEHEDRVKKALRELPRGEHSTGRIAKAAGLNHAKTLRRLRELEASGGVRGVGKRWSTEPPPTDLEEAFDRLKARTSNIRIVRDRSPVG